MVSSSSLLFPRTAVLPLATLTACVTRRGIWRPGRNPVPGYRATKPEEEEEKEEDEERNDGLELRGGASSDIRFYKERAGILEGSQGGWTVMKAKEQDH